MSAEPRGDLPSPWAQECPRSVRLSPGDVLVPSGTLRALLRPGRSLALRYTGFGLEPVIRNGDVVTARAAEGLSAGMLVLCDRDGWGDVVRIASLEDTDQAVVALDALPGRARRVRRSGILAVVIPARRRDAARTPADRLRLLLRGAAIRFAWRRIAHAPSFGADAGHSVEEKYRQQVPDYRERLVSNLTPELCDTIRRHTGERGEVLVCGCGAGGEMLDLCRAGFRVTGFDALTEMIAAARQVILDNGAAAELSVARLEDFDAGTRRFGAIYFTPSLYSFLPVRARRVAALRRIARHVAPGGVLILSVAIPERPLRRLQARLAWLRRRFQGDLVEPGDWYTWFLTPTGDIGTSYLHLFGSVRQAAAEVREAGFRSVRPLGAHLIATDPV
jgi:SAM-dependent methyltransferase